VRLVSFDKGGRPIPGVRRGEAVVDLSAAAPDLPGDWPAIFAAGALPRVAEAVSQAGEGALVQPAGLRLCVPIPNPPKMLCIGLNYRSHAVESGMAIPDYPIVFARWPKSVVAHGEALVRPAASTDFDYEAELVAVIGTGGRHIAKDRALEHVVGYSLFNDGSLRDYQFKANQWTMGKNFDASGSFGPDIATADELPPGAAGLRIQCRVNGEVLQDSDIDDMIFDVATLVSMLSEVMTLEPGDLVVTGTPPGVGFARKPPVWMKPGDVCEVEVEGDPQHSYKNIVRMGFRPAYVRENYAPPKR
jgi:2-keto-4-pentenoate hydratase/2-oxohepta-3-ene-1,7-dioic acid hydratase in catechol pathway